MQDVLLRRVGKAHPVEHDVLTGGGDGFALGAFRRGLRDLCDLFHIAEDARHTADIHEKLHLVCLCRRVGLVDRDAVDVTQLFYDTFHRVLLPVLASAPPGAETRR